MRNPEIGKFMNPNTFTIEHHVRVMTDDGPRIVRGDEPGLPDDVLACLERVKELNAANINPYVRGNTNEKS